METTRSRQTDISVRSLNDVEVSSSNTQTSVVEVDSAGDAGHMLIVRHRPPACAEGRDTKKSQGHGETATRTSSSKKRRGYSGGTSIFCHSVAPFTGTRRKGVTVGSYAEGKKKKEFKPLQIGWTI
jgi:hypothetical protein